MTSQEIGQNVTEPQRRINFDSDENFGSSTDDESDFDENSSNSREISKTSDGGGFLGNTKNPHLNKEFKIRAKRIQITVNEMDIFNVIWEEIKHDDDLLLSVYGKEKAPTTGHEHAHIYIEFKYRKVIYSSKYYNQHIEACKGSKIQNIRYCLKDCGDEWNIAVNYNNASVDEYEELLTLCNKIRHEGKKNELHMEEDTNDTIESVLNASYEELIKYPVKLFYMIKSVYKEFGKELPKPKDE